MAKFLDSAGATRLAKKIKAWATPANIGAAPKSHSHSAADITGGTLPVSRGGTGQTSLASVSVGSATSASRLNVPDTRNDNQVPSWYYSNYPKQVVAEFKTCEKIGLSGWPTYCSLVTAVPWDDSSGGDVVQRAVNYSTGSEYVRRGNGSSWGAWKAMDTNTTYTALKNPYSLTIQGNGTTLANGTYDGSAARTVNITPSSIGAAAASHSHSQYANQNAFSNVVVGSTTIAADSATDTLTLKAGSNVTLTPDADGDSVTIAAMDTGTTDSAISTARVDEICKAAGVTS